MESKGFESTNYSNVVKERGGTRLKFLIGNGSDLGIERKKTGQWQREAGWNRKL